MLEHRGLKDLVEKKWRSLSWQKVFSLGSADSAHKNRIRTDMLVQYKTGP